MDSKPKKPSRPRTITVDIQTGKIVKEEPTPWVLLPVAPKPDTEQPKSED